MNSLAKIVVLLGLAAACSCNIILKPQIDPSKSDLQAGFIFVQGAEIPGKNYQTYAKALQSRFNGSLWVGITEFPFDLPEPPLAGSVIGGFFSQFKQAGFNYTSSTPFFFGGHSLGGIIVQDYLIGAIGSLPFDFAGLVLEGSFITRSKMDQVKNFPPILTLGGELDGLARITRISEAYYHNNQSQNSRNTVASTTLVIPGMNHYQFAGEGNPPPNVVSNDIKPEITNDDAREKVTRLTAAYFHTILNMASQSDVVLLQTYASITAGLVSPIIQAFQLEGFYHFLPPCVGGKHLRSPNCTVGSPWSVMAQKIMGAIDSTNLNVTDTFIQVFSIPEKFPSINNKCQGGQPCVLNINSYTENSYSTFDGLDTGLYPVASTEAKTKMISRQNVYNKYTGQTLNFNQTDAIDVCGQINQASLDLAYKIIPINTYFRYVNNGKVLVVGSDLGPFNNGAQWIANSLSFQNQVDPVTKRTTVLLRSPTLRTPIDYSIKFVAGYHYCKLLTPARAVEWIYVDSLKP